MQTKPDMTCDVCMHGCIQDSSRARTYEFKKGRDNGLLLIAMCMHYNRQFIYLYIVYLWCAVEHKTNLVLATTRGILYL